MHHKSVLTLIITVVFIATSWCQQSGNGVQRPIRAQA